MKRLSDEELESVSGGAMDGQASRFGTRLQNISPRPNLGVMRLNKNSNNILAHNSFRSRFVNR